MKQAFSAVFIGVFLCLALTSVAQLPSLSTPTNNNDIFALDSAGIASTKSMSRERADKLYRCYGYATSTPIYEKLEQNGETDRAMMMHLANNYRLNGNTEKAEFWYAKFIKETDPTTLLFQYAQLLQANGKCETAAYWYKLFTDKATDAEKNGRTYLTDCASLDDIPEQKDVTITNLNFLNTANTELAAVPYDNGVIFTSNRSRTGYSITKDKWTQNNFTDLYFAKRDAKTGSYSQPQLLEGKINGKYHDGTAAFHPSGSTMYFSRNSMLGGDNGYRDLKIYSAENKNGYWTNIEALPFNSDEFSNCHPTISKDGKALYFASNRKGGYGGMDIYVVHLEKDGKWGFPENLGATINSAGNELFPFIAPSGTLYFSSEGHRGFGGLDIFAARNTNTDANNNGNKDWTLCENIGKPFNSFKDDFGFSIDNEAKHGFATSNRTGGFGNDDIYEWSSKSALQFNRFHPFIVVDDRTKTELRDVAVRITEVEGMEDIELKTNDKGIVQYNINKEKTYKINIVQEGYAPYNYTEKGSKILRSKSITLPLEKIALIKWTGIAMKTGSNAVIADANVQIINVKTGKIVYEGKTNSQGFIQFEMPCGEDFELIATATMDVMPYKTKLSTAGRDCFAANGMTTTMNFKEETKNIDLPSPEVVLASKGNTPTNALENATIATNSLIELKAMYYNYDRAEILTESANELDKVVSLLQKYPTMTIELRSHTDARGKDEYNLWLSQRRAESATQYILSKGVAKNRIIAKGYGEKEIRNECTNGIKCDDDQHRFNRRTEIRITSMGGATNVKVSDR
jgi:outer membrane protein OmpA-like peptidoglycan-associated protein